MAVNFNEDFFIQLSQSAAVEGLCVDVAQKIADDIRATAPEDTGAYKRGIEVRVKRQKRVVALVVATDPKSLLIEAKTGTMVRALQRAKRSHG